MIHYSSSTSGFFSSAAFTTDEELFDFGFAGAFAFFAGDFALALVGFLAAGVFVAALEAFLGEAAVFLEGAMAFSGEAGASFVTFGLRVVVAAFTIAQ